MIDRIYLLGIGGIGMSAIAKYYHAKGLKVAGYDRTPSKITAQMQESGIPVHFEDRPDIFIDFSKSERERTLVIYTPAIPETLEELRYIRNENYRLIKRSMALGEIAKDMKCYAVAGTHGKTGTSTLLAHIFKSSGTGCTAFLGGISKNYGSNLIIGNNDIIVAEADEFDRSFLQLYPEAAAITSADADHLDIYGNIESIRGAFLEFAKHVSGTVIIKKGVGINLKGATAKILEYCTLGIGERPEGIPADFYAFDIHDEGEGNFTFSMDFQGERITGCRLGIPGLVNIENAVAASALAFTYGISPEKIREALKTFSGVERRFDIRHKGGKIYIDDYAHHPEELRATIGSVREIFPDRKLTGVFQPHLYTRTRDFADDFAKVLGMLDNIILLDIYPARELPIPGVTSGMLIEKIKKFSGKDAVLLKKDELISLFNKEIPELLVTFGAGDIDRLVPVITEIYDKADNV